MQIANSHLATAPSLAEAKAAEFAVGGDVEEVVGSLESVFASMLVKEMRKTLPEGFFGSEQSDVFGGMFDLHFGQALTEGSGIGLRDQLLPKIAEQLNVEDTQNSNAKGASR